MAVAETLLDAAVTRYGRVYIAAAAVLISLVAAIYFAAVIPEVSHANDLTSVSCCSARSIHCELLPRHHCHHDRYPSAAVRPAILCDTNAL